MHEGVEGAPVFNVSGGDWNDLVDEATALHEERIVVNMGPQHPSTHGVLRLILELDGETVTEARAGIGYLHTGIEKNMEYRTWVQGVTFCTRMDYLTPMFQETAYCLAIERLLGITDQVPERASIIRVLMMELTRINSHLVCLGTGGMELGATTVMTVGFRERERILRVFEAVTGLRMNNAYIRPGGVSQDVPHGAVDMVREVVTELRRGIHELELLLNENPLLKGRTVGVGFMDLTGCMALGMTGPVLRATGLPHDLRKSAPYCGYETYEFDVVTRTGCDAYDRLRIRIDEMYESLKIVEQTLDRLQRTEGQPVMVEDKKIAWPAQLAIGGDGQGNSLDHIREIMGSSMESLIHHFKLVTEGFRVPPGPGLRRGRVGQGRAGLPRRLRRRHPPLPRALPRPELQQPAGRGLDVRGRPGRRRHRGRGLPRPRHGRCRPLMSHDFGLQTASGHLTVSEESKEPYPADVEARFRADAAEVIARYPQKRSALLPLLHLVQSVDGYVTGRGIDLCAELLDLSTAEVSGVATFYTQYKRHPNGTYTVGVCTNTLCAVMGGDEIWDAVSEHLGVGHDETTADGTITLERIECNAACDFAPVVMTNWEFFDNQTPASTIELVDALRAGEPVAPTRGPKQVGTFKEVSRVLAGFHDGLADEGVGAGPASLVGLRLAHEQGWTAPEGDSAASGSGGRAPRTPGSTEVTPDHDEAKADKATTSTAAPPAPEKTEEPGAPVASTGDGVSGVAREVPSPEDTVDPVPPQEAEPDAAGGAANVSAQSASVPPSPTTKKKKGS